mgnify:FL=1|jgi:hypothetical protein
MSFDPEKIDPELKKTVRKATFSLQVTISMVFFGLMIGGFILLYYKMM